MSRTSSRVMTIQDLNKREKYISEQDYAQEINKYQKVVQDLALTLRTEKVKSFKNDRYITLLENQLKEFSAKLREMELTLNQNKIEFIKPTSASLADILKGLNLDKCKELGMSEEEISMFDKECAEKIKKIIV